MKNKVGVFFGSVAALLALGAGASGQPLQFDSQGKVDPATFLGADAHQIASAGATSGWREALQAGGQTVEQQIASELRSSIPYFGNDAPGWLKRTEVNLGLFQGGKPEQSILTVQPLYQSKGKQDTVFVQGSIYHYALYGDYRWTSNIGLGYRRLLDNNHLLLGINGFFDNEFTYGHRRASIGLESKYGPFDFAFNDYFALTGDKSVKGDIEHVMDGRDFQVRSQFPFVPWVKVAGKYYWWDAVKASSDTKGFDVSGEFDLHPNLSVKLGHSDDNLANPSDSGSGYVMVSLHLGGSDGPTLASGPAYSNQIFEKRDLRGETLAKVERENRILVERRTSGGVVIKRGS